ncbi:fused MFS/spermidine synthase [Pyxidicoccus fallax]|uniref:Fused MFS/spermidine synthase n=1 Tax=Pyxidicoccus fallax TaxID=394095 RepID=A0A848LP53_9BACT|nr:fused MFS/spermidine synthase [Pyxidicoccus fallax]NMO19449.1 fused MFS/spermidine synthase [Pyxidicoccus fallax]NPC81184.1 fused MFS/spermidine synthase [Pyxidicoccus fallax]
MRRVTHRLMLVGLALLACSASSPRTVLYEKQSPYTFISVTQDAEGRRYLQFDQTGALQSVVWPGQPLKLELPYTQVSMVGLAFVPEPKRILVVGLGGGAMPMFLRAVVPAAHIDVVDIDPDVVKVAKEYFGFREDERLRAHVADGRGFVEAARPPYDLVFLDAYGPDSIPEHLATLEFLAAVRARLAEGGAVVGNVWEFPPNTRFDSMVRTWQVGFQQLYTFDVEGSGNRILVGLAHARKQERAALEARAEKLERAKGLPFDLSEHIADGYEDATKRKPRGQVLKDAALPKPKAAPTPSP